MLKVGIAIGIYAYCIYLLGLSHQLYPSFVIVLSILYVCVVLILNRRDISLIRLNSFTFSRSPLSIFLLSTITIQAVVNFIGVLGPELSFDALWYHLTLPKLYLNNNSIFHIPGGLYYYSEMPKLGEMLYVSALALGNETLAKGIHFFFGILCLVVLYRLSRMFFSQTISLLVLALFYSNLVVAWESITAYIDLTRTFYELLALYSFILWYKTKDKKLFYYSSIFIGFAVATKLLALSSVLIFSLLILIYLQDRYKKFQYVALYVLLSCLVALPWFIVSFMNRGSPIYPFLTPSDPVHFNFLQISPFEFVKAFYILFTRSADPISPLYAIIVPFTIVFFSKFRKEFKIITIYCAVSLAVWYLLPKIGGGRYILPYLPAFSLVSVYTLTFIKEIRFKYLIFTLILVTSYISIGYRIAANSKYISVILGYESKDEFLSRNLNFDFGDFYDTDGYFKKNIQPSDMVLLYGGHNLFYVDFPFIHSSYVKTGDSFNYILTQNGNIPSRFSHWQLIYINEKTGVKLYSLGGEKWLY